MEPTDARRSGTRRVRLVTAAVAGGALVGTGALTVVVADAHPAAADTASTGTGTTDDGTGTDTGSGGAVTAPGDGTRPTAPTGGVGSGHQGRPHGSSGSS